MTLIDTHTHLYLKEFKQDIKQVIQRARMAGVEKFLLPAIDSAVVDDLLDLENTYQGICYAMIGLHPVSVNENYKNELDLVANMLSKRNFIAVGEIGLDYYWDTTYKSQQIEAFSLQMQWALQYHLPIVIHTRNAMRDTIDLVKPYASKGLRGIFHCFGDTNTIAKEIIDMGFYLGIGGVVTYKKANLEESLSDIPLENIVLETDAPYLTPQPHRGKRNESSYLTFIAEKLASIKGVTMEEVASITTNNANSIFGL